MESDIGNAVTHRHKPYSGYGATIASTQYPDASVPHRRYRYSVDFARFFLFLIAKVGNGPSL